MTPRALKSLAVAGLALAIALLGLSLASGLQASSITGPAALGVTAQGEVWIGVDKELWRAAADGRLLHADAAKALGLSGPPSGLVRQPDGHLVATVRHDPALYVLDPASAHVLRTIVPRWPDDLKDKGQDAINVAFAPDGRIAIATGGGHTVALFDATGAFLARTPPGTYRYTNGLWWAGDELWTTDTNRFALRHLDGHTLAVKASTSLPDDDPARFLGPARGSNPDDPTVALIRYRNGMTTGRIVLVRADGTETALPSLDAFEPVDVDWLGHSLLATDDASWTVRRWQADGHVAGDFGDADFAQRLRHVARHRGDLWKRHRLALWLGIPIAALALALAVIATRRGADVPPDATRLDLSRLGTPQLGDGARIVLGLRILWPMLALLAATQLPRVAVVPQWVAGAVPRGAGALVASVVAFVFAWMLLALVLSRGIQRKSRLPEFEPVSNSAAVRRLLATRPAQLPMAAGEHVLETFVLTRHDAPDGRRARWRLPHGRAAARWVVCTNHGVRVFGLTGPAPWLDLEFALADIADVSTQPPSARAANWSAAWVEQRSGRGGWLAIGLPDGRTLQGSVASLPTHARVAALLASARPDVPAPPRAAPVPAAPATAGPSRAQAAIASAVLPGFGQWWQRRPGTGLLFVVPWAVTTLAFTIPLAWTLLGARADVSARHIALVLGLQLGYAALAAWDAWQMGRPRRSGA